MRGDRPAERQRAVDELPRRLALLLALAERAGVDVEAHRRAIERRLDSIEERVGAA